MMQKIPLDEAVLCLDCNTISNAIARCSGCGSATLWPIQSWIDRGGEPTALQTIGSPTAGARDEENPALTSPTVSRSTEERKV